MKTEIKSEFNNTASSSGAVTSRQHKDLIRIESNLEGIRHDYLWSRYLPMTVMFPIHQHNVIQVFMLSSTPNGISVAFVFYNAEKHKIADAYAPSNQSKEVNVPDAASFFRVAVRVQGGGVFELDNLLIGSRDSINEEIQKLMSFDYQVLAGLVISKQPDGGILPDTWSRSNRSPNTPSAMQLDPLILIETVFCDIETAVPILQRYLSYLFGNIWMLKASKFRNFRWGIYCSSDKQEFIKKIKEEILKSRQEDAITLIEYIHPLNGYGNEKETHIDRIKRPNSTYAQLRDSRFDSFKSFLNLPEYPNQIYIRLAIDDDDFILPEHFSNIARIAAGGIAESPQKELIVAFASTFITKFSANGKVDLDCAIISRAITGNKCTVKRGAFPRNPLSIPEKITEIRSLETNSVRVIIDESANATISYNRHGQNLSSHSKDCFYTELLVKKRFKSISELSEYFLSDKLMNF